MSELLERHTEYELREQYVAEQHWPTGEPAANERIKLLGEIIESIMVGGQAGKRARKSFQRLMAIDDKFVNRLEKLQTEAMAIAHKSKRRK